MISPAIIYEDKKFIAVEKPAGFLTHTISAKHSGNEPALTLWLLKRYPEIKKVGDDPKTRPGIVHRLDRDTSGVLLVARTQSYFHYLKSLFQKHEIEKTYLALVCGEVSGFRGAIEKSIGLTPGTTKHSTFSKKMSKEAVTYYRVLKRLSSNSESYTLLEVKPKTGRTHQIRVHLASIGHSVVGDKLYGGKRFAISNSTLTKEPPRLMLHALSLEFTTQEGKRIKIEAEPPRDFKEILERLGLKA